MFRWKIPTNMTFRFANRDALEEIHRVLKPGGYFGVIWNAEDCKYTLLPAYTWQVPRLTFLDNSPRDWAPQTQWESKLKDITWRQDDNHPRFRHSVWKNVLGDKEKQPILFSQPLEEGSVPFTKFLAPGAVWDRFHTLSQIAVLQGKELEVSGLS